jgi:uncharacterized protein YggE
MTTRARRPLIPRLLPVLVMCAITSVTFARPRYVRGQVVPAGGAAPQQDVITVSGTAQVKGKPTEVEIGALVSGEAELTNDAMVKYRDARKRAVAAIEALKLPNLTIESHGVSVNQAMDPNAAQMMMQGRVANLPKPKIQASESMKIVLKDVAKQTPEQLMDMVMKVIDTGRDAGLQIGPPTPQNYYQYQIAMQNGQGMNIAQFKVGDPTSQRDEAYKQAMDDAKKRAQRLADLAGVKLGRIVSVTDGGQAANPQAQYQAYYGMPMPPQDNNDLTSTMLGDIPLRVSVTVQFEIAK